MTGLHAAKAELRAAMQQKLGRIPKASIVEQSRLATVALCAMPIYQMATRISIYLSMPQGELMTNAIVEDALAHDKEVFVPCFQASRKADGSRKMMNMAKLESQADLWDCLTRRDSWGIPFLTQEQIAKRRKVFHDDHQRHVNLDMIILPGVAFDIKLARLGHGKGFYDLFLQQYKTLCTSIREKPVDGSHMPFLVGLALKEQILSDHREVPTGASDWRVNALVTGRGHIIGDAGALINADDAK